MQNLFLIRGKTLERNKFRVRFFNLAVSNSEMRNFFDEQGRTRVLVEAYIGVRRRRKPAENAAHRKKVLFRMETSYVSW